MNLIKKILAIPLVRGIFEIVFIVLPIVFTIRTFGFGLYQVPTGSMEPTLLVGESFFADKLNYWLRKPQRGEIISMNQPTYKYSANPLINFYERYISFNVENWTKRIIAIPGDHIKGVIEDGKPVIYLNEKRLDEPYLNKYPLILTKGNANYGTIPKTFDPNVSWENQPFYKIDPSEILKNKLGQPLIIWPNTPYPNNKDVFDITLPENKYWCMGDNRLGSADCRVFGFFDGRLFHGRILFRILSVDSNESWWIKHFIKSPIDFIKKIRWPRCFQFVA